MWEIKQLAGIREQLNVRAKDGNYIYPWEILTPCLKQFVRTNMGYPSYVNWMPFCGPLYVILGWDSMPDTSSLDYKYQATFQVTNLNDKPQSTLQNGS